jgi:hypothetical protein
VHYKHSPLELAREGKGRDPRPAKDVASSGGIFFDIANNPDLIRDGYSIQWYVWFLVLMHVCMYVCIHRGC